MDNRPPPSSESYLARAIIIVGAAAWLVMLVTAVAQRVTIPTHQAKGRTQPTATVASQVPATRGVATPTITPVPLATIARGTIDPNAILTDISFQDQTVSADGKTLSLKLAITNAGLKTIHLTKADISLQSGDAPAVTPASVDVSLPLDIQPGAMQEMTLAFAKPPGNVATFRLLDFSVDLYF